MTSGDRTTTRNYSKWKKACGVQGLLGGEERSPRKGLPNKVLGLKISRTRRKEI